MATIDAKYYHEFLEAVLEEEAHIKDSIQQIRKALQHNISALTSFHESMKEYDNMLSINLEEYMASFAQKNASSEF